MTALYVLLLRGVEKSGKRDEQNHSQVEIEESSQGLTEGEKRTEALRWDSEGPIL